MVIKNWLVSLGFLASVVLVSGSADAATFSFDLSGDMSTVTVQNGTFSGTTTPYQSQRVNLTNTATGLQELGPLTLNVGDTINVTVSLSGLMTIPVSDRPWFSLPLLDTPGLSDLIFFDESVSLFNGGALVSVPGLTPFGASQGFLSLGAYTNSAPVPSFAFDKFTVSAVVTAILDDWGGSDISPLGLFAQTPQFAATYEFQATTPIPGTALLMLTGLGSLAGAAKLRRRLRSRWAA